MLVQVALAVDMENKEVKEVVHKEGKVPGGSLVVWEAGGCEGGCPVGRPRASPGASAAGWEGAPGSPACLGTKPCLTGFLTNVVC